MQVYPDGQVIAETAFVNRTLKGAQRRAFFCKKERKTPHLDFLAIGMQTAADKDVVEESPEPPEVIGALGSSQFPAALRHEGSHAFPYAAEDCIARFGVEVAHE